MPIFKNAAQYRIGDFARFLGVTPDFLKHYEGTLPKNQAVIC